MYWTDTRWDMISRSNLDGSQVETLVSIGLETPTGLALDTSGSGSGGGATRLTLGSSRAGRIETRDEVDYFKVQVREFGVLTIYTTGGLNTTGTLHNSASGSLATDDNGGSGDNFRIEHTVTPGIYFVKVEGVGSNTGDYTIHASVEAVDHDTRSGATSLPLGGSRLGWIGPSDDVNYFKVEVREFGVLTVYTTGSLDTKGTLEDSLGNFLARRSLLGGSDIFRIVRTVGAGTYYVKVEGRTRRSTGDYTIHASVEAVDHDTRSGATSLPLGGSLPGRIASRDDVDYFEVEVSEAGVLTVYTTGSFDTEGTLEDSLGNFLEHDLWNGSGDNFRIEHTVTPGIYFVKVEGVGSNTGDYTIHASVEAVDHDTRSGATSLPLGGSLPGRIASRDDVDYFEVEVSEAGVLTVYTTGSFDTEGTLEDSLGNRLEHDLWDGSGKNFRIVRTVSAGTYYVKVESRMRSTGDYTIHASFEADDHSDTRSGATSLPLGGSLPGRIASRDDVDYFEVEVSEAGVLTVYTTGSFDTEGTLEDSLGNRLEHDLWDGSGKNFRIVRTVSAGTYYVKVESRMRSTGDYIIHASFRGGG